MPRELSGFLLPASHRMKLQNAGFAMDEDIISLKPSELSKEIEVSMDDALAILSCVKPVKNAQDSKNLTALEMLRDEDMQQHIVTFSEKLDGILGGGVPIGKITEFCGAPGIGKTQMCIQLCVDVQIPECFGGLGGEAVYIDTEGSFIVERVVSIATATVAHCKQIAASEDNPEHKDVLSSFDFKAVLNRIHYFRCHNHIELLALIHILPEILSENPKIKIVACDSIAFPFRHEFEDLSLRTRLLNGLAQGFIKMATQFKLAVVLTNQMTTKLKSGGAAGGFAGSELAPALGESWGHASTIRLVLHWEGGERRALMYKSPSHQETTVPYQITMGGIRDVIVKTEPRHQTSRSEEDMPAAKRQKLAS